ncbi:protein phosphatase [Scenedesmus sp. PABB004]|nr:protein phosphatase [Scenedesmus sp. PABB004]
MPAMLHGSAAPYSATGSHAQALQRHEDYVLAAPRAGGPHYSVWALFDGHGGPDAARSCAEQLVGLLQARLPAGPLPLEAGARYHYADHVRRALAAVFLQLAVSQRHAALQEAAAHGGGGGGGWSWGSGRGGCGTSATVAVQAGGLLTVANVGSARCVLDVGHTAFECTQDHRLGDNEEEEERLDAAGARVARLRFDLSGPAAPGETGCGPLRLWPGGLHMSRAIGSFDCGEHVIPHPYIQQVWLPRRASRLIVASSTVWDAFETFQKAADALRDVSLPHAADALLRRAARRRAHLHDRGDMSVLVVDLVPERCSAFSSQMKLDRLSRCSACSGVSAASGASGGGGGGGLFRRRGSAPQLASKSWGAGGGQWQPPPPAQHYARVSPNVGSSAATSPVLTPSSSSRSISSGGEHGGVPGHQQQQQKQHQQQQQEQQQQQQQQQPGGPGGPGGAGLLHWLLPRCFAPPGVHEFGSAGAPAPGAQPRQPAQQASFGSGSASEPHSATSTAAATPAPSAGGWRRGGWRRRGVAPGAPPGALGLIREDPTVARVIARCDAFRDYCHGRIAPLDRQLAALDVDPGWAARRAHAGGAAAHLQRASAGASPMATSGGSSDVSSSGTFALPPA